MWSIMRWILRMCENEREWVEWKGRRKGFIPSMDKRHSGKNISTHYNQIRRYMVWSVFFPMCQRCFHNVFHFSSASSQSSSFSNSQFDSNSFVRQYGPDLVALLRNNMAKQNWYIDRLEYIDYRNPFISVNTVVLVCIIITFYTHVQFALILSVYRINNLSPITGIFPILPSLPFNTLTIHAHSS